MSSKKSGTNLKYDEGKLRLDLVPPEALAALARVFESGAAKYEEHGWEKGGLTANRLYAATQRHLMAFWRHQLGLSCDPLDAESTLPHLYHALACVTMLITLIERGLLD